MQNYISQAAIWTEKPHERRICAIQRLTMTSADGRLYYLDRGAWRRLLDVDSYAALNRLVDAETAERLESRR